LGKKQVINKKGRLRTFIQALSALGLNGNLTGFAAGKIYTGPLKGVCVPVLNCYSCPGALGACPIGALQSSLSTIGGKVSYYVVGALLLFAVTLGRFFCGFLCPFGWLQELLYKIPTKKTVVQLKIDQPLRYLKYAVLLVLVVGLPLLLRNALDMSTPYFCKWLCPAGTLEAGVPLALTNAPIRESLGGMFLWKMLLLAGMLVASVAVCRPFCKYICPLGAFYGLFARMSLLRYRLDEAACTHCGACKAVCQMQVDPVTNPNSAECIRCGACIHACPHGALHVAGRSRKQEKGVTTP